MAAIIKEGPDGIHQRIGNAINKAEMQGYNIVGLYLTEEDAKSLKDSCDKVQNFSVKIAYYMGVPVLGTAPEQSRLHVTYGEVHPIIID